MQSATRGPLAPPASLRVKAIYDRQVPIQQLLAEADTLARFTANVSSLSFQLLSEHPYNSAPGLEALKPTSGKPEKAKSILQQSLTASGFSFHQIDLLRANSTATNAIYFVRKRGTYTGIVEQCIAPLLDTGVTYKPMSVKMKSGNKVS